jgi:hypothetical protein
MVVAFFLFIHGTCPQLRAAASSLRGSIESALRVDEGLSFSMETLTLNTSLQTLGCLFSARAEMAESVWSAFRVGADAVLGDIAVNSIVAFEIQTPSFKYLIANVIFDALGVSFRDTFYLTGVGATSYNRLTMRWSCNGITCRSDLRFWVYSPAFRSANIRCSWAWPKCDAIIESALSLTQADGFDHFALRARGIPVPWLSGDGVTTTVDLRTRFSVDAKEITPNLRVRTSRVSCGVTPYVDIIWQQPFEVTGISLYGLQIAVDLEDGIQATFATSFDETRNRQITGDGDFFELWRATGPITSCCVSSGRWEFKIYFEKDEPPPQLFNWGKGSFLVELPIGKNIVTSVAMEVRPAHPRWVLWFGTAANF